jgi:glycosyltransferase involved in cell wall biosynthesis
MYLLVTVFALDEERTIGEVVARVPRIVRGFDRVDVLVVDDGSTDRTAAIAREHGATVLSHHRNRGLGAAFRSGLGVALERGADAMVTIDGDGQFDPAQIPQLVAPIVDGDADMTTCSRFKDPSLVPEMPPIKRWGNSVVSRLVSRLTGQRLHDVSCGYRAYSSDAMMHLNLMGSFTYTHEAIMELIFMGLDIVEVPLPVRGVRSFGESRIASNVFAYGVRTLRIMLATVLNHRPHTLFLVLGAISLVLGCALCIGGGIPYLRTGSYIKSLMFTGGFFLGLSVVFSLFALQARVLYRNQHLLAHILYESRVRARPAARLRHADDRAEHQDTHRP